MSSPYAMHERGSNQKPTDIDAVWADLYTGINEIYNFKKAKMSTNRYMVLYT